MSLSLLYITSLLFLETIEKCSDGCNSCYSSDPENTCYNCLPGYYEIKIPNSSYVKCEKCEANYCDTCLPATPNICSSCQSHYFFEGEICSKCDYNCKECLTTSADCTSCNTGKYLNNSQCLPCNSNCYECENSPGHCTACKTGKYLSYSLCNPCSSNCKTCETKSTNCLSCYDGKYLSNFLNAYNVILIVKHVKIQLLIA